ncbi:MAG: extracellular solute-binding protein [Patescibacteria group bacterium]|nr:extracellular solute-binding protein [Patescibacteria group bacterium]
MSLKSSLSIILLIFFFSITGYVLVKSYPKFKTPYSHIVNNEPIVVTLEFWGIWDNSDDWQKITDKFKNKTYNLNGQKINIIINYTKKNYNSYENEIAESTNKKNGPNIFMINNNWFEKYLNQLEPLENNEAYKEEYDFLSYSDIPDIFPTRIIMDVVYKNQLYGMPLNSDSLALYYNKDLFKKANLTSPPSTWKDFKKYTKKLTTINKKGHITQSGAIFGAGSNINRSSDILSLLIIQGGGKIIDENKAIDINKEIEVNTIDGIEKRNPGKNAIEFYTEFSNPKKEIYSWDSNWENSIKTFTQGKAAMMIGYEYHINNLIVLNSNLNYDIAKMPQLENSTPINFSNTWIPVVSNRNNCKVEPIEFANEIDCKKISWSFLSFAIEKENSKKYLDLTNKIASRKDLIEEQIKANDKTSVFASQIESSLNYNKFDDQIDIILTEMIDNINLDEENLLTEVDNAVVKIESLKTEN